MTAAQIVEKLNTKFKSLNIISSSVGKNLIPRIEKRTGKTFARKTVHGRNFILCPPFADDSEYKTQTPVLSDYVANDKT